MLPRLVIAVMLLTTRANAQVASGTVMGKICDITGLPIRAAQVTLEGPTSTAGAHTDAAGEFVIEDIPLGTYTLRVEAPGFMSKGLKVEIGDTGVKSVGLVTVDIVPPPPCLDKLKAPIFSERKLPSGGKSQIVGSTRIETGVALPHWTIVLRSPKTSSEIGTVTTDQDGRFEFGDIPPGSYELEIGAWPRIKNVRVKRGYQLEVSLTWTPGQLCL